MANPYFCYAVAFAAALLTYLLGWSDLYPPLSLTLLFFILVTVIIHVFLGIRFFGKKIIIFKKIQTENHFAPLLVTIFLYVLWCSEFLYEGGVPLIKILLKQPYNYRIFGIPSLHVFVVTFSSFYTVYLFQLFLSHKSKKILLLYLINLLAALLIYSRAMFFFNLTSSLFIYLIFLKSISLRKVAFISLLLVPLFFLFGLLGSLRVSREAKEPYNNENFMNIGKAKNDFKQSGIPKEYFWAYIYISSPLANLQQNINGYPIELLSIRNFAEMFNSEVLPDFLSKRINRLFSLEQYKEKTIPGPFNVSTVYSRSYSYAGWWGMIITALVVISIPLLFLKILPPSSNFFLCGWAILCTMYFFLMYDNTLRFTGLSFQLAYPVLFNWVSKAKIKRFKYF